MKPADYALRLKVLRRERDYHQSEVDRLQVEIDSMDGNIHEINPAIGEYVCVDNTNSSGYKHYIHVKSYNKKPGGICLMGPGFEDGELFLAKADEHNFFGAEAETIRNISEEEFYQAFDEYVKSIRDTLTV